MMKIRKTQMKRKKRKKRRKTRPTTTLMMRKQKSRIMKKRLTIQILIMNNLKKQTPMKKLLKIIHQMRIISLKRVTR